MKLQRWLVLSLLSVSMFAVPGAGAWWWITWPERTAAMWSKTLADRLATLKEPKHPGSIQSAKMFRHGTTDWMLARAELIVQISWEEYCLESVFVEVQRDKTYEYCAVEEYHDGRPVKVTKYPRTTGYCAGAGGR